MPRWKYLSYRGDPNIKGLEEWFIDLSDKVRGIAGVPLIVTSGLRKSTSKIGVKNSAHEKGVAIDARSTSSFTHYRFVLALIRNGIKRIGIYVKPFPCQHCKKLITEVKLRPSHIHFDKSKDHPQEVLWVGVSK